MRFKRYTKSGLKLAILAGVFALTLEIVARIDDAITWNAPFFERYTNEETRDHDDDGIRYNIPNASFEKWQHNQYGFRGPAYAMAKPDSAVRVVCMGTSETYGGCEAVTWPEHLRQKLESTGHFEIINPSVAGLRFKEYEPYLSKRVAPFRPDLVIIIFNPVTYFVNLDRWPNFSPEKRKKNRQPQTTAAGGYNFSISWILKQSRVLPKAKLVIKRFLPQTLVQKYQIRSAKEKIQQMEAEYLKGGEPRQQIPRNYVDSLHNQLGRLITSLQMKGVEVVLTTYPTLLNKDNKNDYPSIFLENQRFYVELTLDGMIDAADKYRQMLPELCKEYGIDYIDLESRVPKSPDYFCDNVHYYDNAADSVATAVAEYLTRKYRSVVSASVAAPSP